MTEERIGKLLEEAGYPRDPYLIQAIRTVAAESRKETKAEIGELIKDLRRAIEWYDMSG